MTVTRRHTFVLGAVALVLVPAASLACGDPGPERDPTPVQTFKITPADGSRPRTPTPPPAAEPTAPGSIAGSIEVAGVSNEFDKEELGAAAGTVSVVFDNRDGGIIHNIRFFEGDGPTGREVGGTELEVGPVVQTAELTFEPGVYYYHCDAHPTTMSGTLIVE